VFGGTFDPPHLGHLVTAVNVGHALQLDDVLMVVANRPWQKEADRRVTPADDRLAMVQAATVGVDRVSACALEIERGGVSYTADTLVVLHQLHPDAELFTIVGDDAAAGIETWERVDDVAALSTLVVVDRPGEHAALSTRFAWTRVEVPHLEVSSTDLRARCADGRPLDFLVPDAVRRVIEDRGLYR
jgi:nicotinate-nucleotide adenylyltransferase